MMGTWDGERSCLDATVTFIVPFTYIQVDIFFSVLIDAYP